MHVLRYKPNRVFFSRKRSLGYVNKFIFNKVKWYTVWRNHWLTDSNMHLSETINRNYTGFGVSDNELRIVGARRIGKGGIAIMWHNSISRRISCLDIESDRICGIQIRINRNNFVYISQVYAP